MEDIRIYIAEQRGETAIGDSWVRSILNYDSYIAPHRDAIGSLHHANEWTGRAGQTFILPLPAQHVFVFVPLAGGLVVQTTDKEYTVSLGSLLVLPVDMDTAVSVRQSGPGEDYFVFQQFVFSSSECRPENTRCYVLPIVHISNKNKLLPVLEKGDAPFQIYIGAFAGKVEDTLTLDSAFRHTFATTLDGNFEVEQRLLFSGDALFLPGLEKLEAECLSNTGVLLILHF